MNKTGAIIIEGHVQGLSNVRSLGELGIPVYIVDKTNCIARYSKYCKKFFKCPDFILDEFAEFLVNLAKKENLKDWVLIPSNDHAVYTLAKHKLILQEYYKIIVPDLNQLENIYDKANLLSIAKQCSVPIPSTQYFKKHDDTIQADILFPLITKGRNGLSFYKTLGTKAFLAHSENELRDQLKLIEEKYAVDKSFTQELIPFNGKNKTISFTAFCVKGDIKAYWMGVKLREHPLQFGTATYAKSIFVKECLSQSESLLKTLEYTGVCEVEYLLDPRTNEYKLIEINARTWLWVGLAKACGIDYAKMIYFYLNDIHYSYPTDYTKNVGWLNSITDIPYSFMGVLRGKYSINDIIVSYINKHQVAVFQWNDTLPFFAEIILLPLLIIKR